MTFYKDANQIYTVLQELFGLLRHATPNPIDALVAFRLSIRLSLMNPKAQIIIDGKKHPVKVSYGQVNGRTDLEIEMTAEQMHLILLDQYSIKSGFASGELKVRGPIWKMLPFVDVFINGRTYYPQVLKEHNFG